VVVVVPVLPGTVPGTWYRVRSTVVRTVVLVLATRYLVLVPGTITPTSSGMVARRHREMYGNRS